MRSGYAVTCSKCGFNAMYTLGAGMLFPRVYEELVGDILAGKHGQEWKDYFNTIPGAAVLAEKELYRCSNCNTLLSDYNLALYKRNDGTPPDHGCWVYWCDHDYTFVKSYRHMCPKCSRRMHKVSISRSTRLPCPECGSALEIDDGIMWD